MTNNVPELLAKHRAEGDRFAVGLANFIVDQQPDIVVETGYGVSTLFILDALETNQRGRLVSVDPAPWFADRITHPRHTLVTARSADALASVYRSTGPWDLFLHDSNHDVECMTFELMFAYAALKPEGWLFCDDYTWGAHGAWDALLRRHGLTDIKIGSLAGTQKNTFAPSPMTDHYAEKYAEACRVHAREVTEEQRAAGREVVSAAFR